jgi:hypothetical protein
MIFCFLMDFFYEFQEYMYGLRFMGGAFLVWYGVWTGLYYIIRLFSVL